MRKHIELVSAPRLAFNPDEDILLDVLLLIPAAIWDTITIIILWIDYRTKTE